jgi:hypothetical protein
VCIFSSSSSSSIQKHDGLGAGGREGGINVVVNVTFFIIRRENPLRMQGSPPNQGPQIYLMPTKSTHPNENSVTQITTQNGKLRIHSPKWKFTHLNENSPIHRTFPRHTRDEFELQVEKSNQWKFSHPPKSIPHNFKTQVENSLTQMKIWQKFISLRKFQKGQHCSAKWKFDEANTHLFPFKGTNALSNY